MWQAMDHVKEMRLIKKKIKKVREIVTEFDWPCEVKTLFRNKNLGCKKGISSAINWFF